MNIKKLSTSTVVIGLILLVAAVFLVPRLLGNNDDDNSNNSDNPVGASDSSADLGQIVTATQLDRDGCSADSTSSFSTTQSVYVVAENSRIDQGTQVFVRLYRDGNSVEDAAVITADADYGNTCINFVFDPTNAGFTPGQYEAEFIVNGNQQDSVSFEVR